MSSRRRRQRKVAPERDLATLAPNPAIVAAHHRLPWWATPSGICVGFLVPVLLLIGYVGGVHHPALTVRGHRFLDWGYVGLGLALLLAAAIAGWVGQQVEPRKSRTESPAALIAAAKIIGLIALATYCLWLRGYLFNPVTLFEVLTGQLRPGREQVGGAGGLESFLNFTPVFFSLVAYAYFAHDAPLDRLTRFLIVALALLTLYRVYLWSERLAFVEISVPVALAWVLSPPRRWPRAWRLIRRYGPFLAVPMLIAYFGATEYVRSWQSDSYRDKMGFFDFAVGRFASYYFTALNNGAGMLATLEWPTYTFNNTAQWLHRLPLVGSLFQRVLSEFKINVGRDFLEEYGDPEFNNPSGLYVAILDLGIAGALLYFALIAFATALLARRYEKGTGLGISLFPVFFMSFLEIFRYPYLGSSRAFAGVVAAFLVVVLMHGRQARIERRRARDTHSSSVRRSGSWWTQTRRWTTS